MKHFISQQLALLAVLLMAVGTTKAQQSVHAAGGDAAGTGGSVAFSIGQVFYTTEVGTEATLAQGVQHAYEIFVLDVSEAATHPSVALYPVPARDQLTIQLSEYRHEDWSYRLLDEEGSLIRTEKITAQQTLVNMADLSSATYLVQVYNNEEYNIQSFKIIKQ